MQTGFRPHRDSTTIQLAYWCIDWAKHRQRKAAVKVHMVANVANRLPHFCVFGKAKDHDSKMEDELFNSLKEGDIGIADRAYNCFKALYRQSRRGVFFVVREKSGMRYRVVKRVAKKDLGENILSDETIQLTGQRTSKEYPDAMRRVKARVNVDGKWRTMVFLTNNFEWSASTIAELYNALGGQSPCAHTVVVVEHDEEMMRAPTGSSTSAPVVATARLDATSAAAPTSAAAVGEK